MINTGLVFRGDALLHSITRHVALKLRKHSHHVGLRARPCVELSSSVDHAIGSENAHTARITIFNKGGDVANASTEPVKLCANDRHNIRIINAALQPKPRWTPTFAPARAVTFSILKPFGREVALRTQRGQLCPLCVDALVIYAVADN